MANLTLDQCEYPNSNYDYSRLQSREASCARMGPQIARRSTGSFPAAHLDGIAGISKDRTPLYLFKSRCQHF
jgi:hypothetical protein